MANKPISMHKFANYANELIGYNNIRAIADIGCMDGTHTEQLATLYPDASVYGIEGSPRNFEHYGLASKNGRVIYIQQAIAQKGVIANYYTIENSRGQSGLLHHPHYNNPNWHEDIVTLEPMCDVMDIYNIPLLDMVKIDCEGMTYDVLASFGDRLEKLKIMHIETECREYFPEQHLRDDVVNLLENAGFELVNLSQVFNVEQYDEVWVNRRYKL